MAPPVPRAGRDQLSLKTHGFGVHACTIRRIRCETGSIVPRYCCGVCHVVDGGTFETSVRRQDAPPYAGSRPNSRERMPLAGLNALAPPCEGSRRRAVWRLLGIGNPNGGSDATRSEGGVFH